LGKEEALSASLLCRVGSNTPAPLSESGGDIDLVLMLSRERASLPRPTNDGEPITMFEGDAVALALGMAGFDRRKELATWRGNSSVASPLVVYERVELFSAAAVERER
jgi:hypothetical protein